jgi:hypothetical protein
VNITLLDLVWWVGRPKPSHPPAPSPSVCDLPAEPGAGPARLVCGLGHLGDGLAGLPARLARLAVDAWPTVALALLLCAVAALGGYAVWRWCWSRAAARGVWVQVVLPREVHVGQSRTVWRLLVELTRQSRAGWWRLARPPLAMEIHGDAGRLRLALWVPPRIGYAAVAAEVARAWPGATVSRFDGARTVRRPWPVAGFRLAASAGADDGFLVDDADRTGRGRGWSDADPLGPVFDALGSPGGPTVLQVLAVPASRRRLRRLAAAACAPPTPRRTGAALAADGVGWLVTSALRAGADFLGDMLSSGRRTPTTTSRTKPVEPPTGLQREAMREAARKTSDAPHFLVAVRAFAARPVRGQATAAASTVAYGYKAASPRLRPVRLRRAWRAYRDRFAHRGEWLLLTASELGVLAHVPADPGRWGFPIAAMRRPVPVGITHLDPEAATHGVSGWTTDGWTPAPPLPDDDNLEDYFD